jgi:hypothetical protein
MTGSFSILFLTSSTLDGMTFSIKTFSITTFSIKTFSITTFSITTFSITTFSIKGSFLTLGIAAFSTNDTKHNSTSAIMLNVVLTVVLSVIMLRVVILSVVAPYSQPWRPGGRGVSITILLFH